MFFQQKNKNTKNCFFFDKDISKTVPGDFFHLSFFVIDDPCSNITKCMMTKLSESSCYVSGMNTKMASVVFFSQQPFIIGTLLLFSLENVS